MELSHGHITNEIIQEIRRHDYDLVVAGSSRNTGRLRSYVIGNVTREIVNRADCPVLVVRIDEGLEIGRRLKQAVSKITDAFAKSEKNSDKK